MNCIKTSGVEVNLATPPKKLGCSGYLEAMGIFVLTGLWPVLDAHAETCCSICIVQLRTSNDNSHIKMSVLIFTL